MSIPFIIDEPLTFAFDPDTGLTCVNAVAGVEKQGTPLQMCVTLLLTPKTALSLLESLPTLAQVLLRAKEGKTNPSFLQ